MRRTQLRDIDAGRIAQTLVDDGHPLRVHIAADSELPDLDPAPSLALAAA